MIDLTLSIILAGGPETVVSVSGETVTVDGTAYDLSAIPEGAEATPEGDHPFLGTITREGGTLRATVLYRLDNTAARIQPQGEFLFPSASGALVPDVPRIEQEAPE